MEVFGRVYFFRDEDNLLIELGDLSKRLGLNGRNWVNLNDKSKFYVLFERIPRH